MKPKALKPDLEHRDADALNLDLERRDFDVIHALLGIILLAEDILNESSHDVHRVASQATLIEIAASHALRILDPKYTGDPGCGETEGGAA
jgi:hypothetical protein